MMLRFPDWLACRDWRLMKSLPAHQQLMMLLGWAGRQGMTRGEIGSLVRLPRELLDELLDGYCATPEYNAILRSSLPRAEKQRMVDEASDLSTTKLSGPRGLSLIKWFHDHGVPQVVQLSQKVFAGL